LNRLPPGDSQNVKPRLYAKANMSNEHSLHTRRDSKKLAAAGAAASTAVSDLQAKYFERPRNA
jgi:gamma-glutamyl-gamma-aminobutyrate hydrolase PuuD